MKRLFGDAIFSDAVFSITMLAFLLSACGQNAPASRPTVVQVIPTSVPTATIAPTVIPWSTKTLSDAILEPHGYVSPVHDPVLTKEKNKYYVFSTGAGIPIHCSNDMREWEYCGRVFHNFYPDWVGTAVPGVGDLWAPDISFYSGKYHLYYSGSSFGSNRSVIGLATNATLDQKDPRYKWQDEGEVISSKPGNDYNAIDPNLVIDAKGQAWLALGSFWSGIKLVPLDANTGKPVPDAKLYALASNPGSDAIEGSFIVRRGDFYYLFVSHDFCCKGVDSTYKIMVGRSQEITGPYTDADGKPMLGGGGTLVYAGSARWRGPGHNAIYVENDIYFLVYHSYDAQAVGAPTLRIEELFWDQDGWLHAPSALLQR